jgi:hypothetical protein
MNFIVHTAVPNQPPTVLHFKS